MLSSGYGGARRGGGTFHSVVSFSHSFAYFLSLSRFRGVYVYLSTSSPNPPNLYSSISNLFPNHFRLRHLQPLHRRRLVTGNPVRSPFSLCIFSELGAANFSFKVQVCKHVDVLGRSARSFVYSLSLSLSLMLSAIPFSLVSVPSLRRLTAVDQRRSFRNALFKSNHVCMCVERSYTDKCIHMCIYIYTRTKRTFSEHVLQSNSVMPRNSFGRCFSEWTKRAV